jgi:FkbM family methyltransferase
MLRQEFCAFFVPIIPLTYKSVLLILRPAKKQYFIKKKLIKRDQLKHTSQSKQDERLDTSFGGIAYRKRIEIACECRDCDSIAKVVEAGVIITPPAPDKPYQIMHNGLKVYTDSHYGDFNVEVIRRLRGHHEPQEEKVFHEVLKTIPANSVMIELGSFWAYYSLWFNREILHAVNYMIEPIQEVMERGKANFSLNNIHGDFSVLAIGKETKPNVPFQHWDGTCRNVGQICVDDFIASKNIPFVHILHADIQGSEYEMLKGAHNALTDHKIGRLFISTHSELLHQQCMRYLQHTDYKIIAEHTPAESYSEDGLIVACQDQHYTGEINVSKRTSIKSRLKKIRAHFRLLFKTV